MEWREKFRDLRVVGMGVWIRGTSMNPDPYSFLR